MIPGAARLVLATAFIVLLFNSGSRFLMGLTLHPMTVDLGWTRTTVSAAVTFFMVVSAVSLPFVGRLVDRLGARRVLAGGAVLSGLSFACLGFVQTPVQLLALYGVLFALGSAATSVTPIGVLVTRWFPDRAGLANSVAIAGMGVGQLIVISALAAHLEQIGWRGAYTLVGIVMVVTVLPLVWLVGLAAPQQAPPVRSRTAGASSAVTEFGTLGEALRSKRFALVLLSYVICGFQDFMIATHVVAFALDEGVGVVLAGNMLAFMGLAGLLGVLTAGLLNDRYGPAVPTAVNYVLRIALFTLVLISREPVAIVGAALLYGATFWMTAPLAVVFARMFAGFALLGALSGLITMVHHIAGGAGALFGAQVFDVSGSYDGAMQVMLGLSILGLALSPWLRRAGARLTDGAGR